jgi:hypothetical protein
MISSSNEITLDQGLHKNLTHKTYNMTGILHFTHSSGTASTYTNISELTCKYHQKSEDTLKALGYQKFIFTDVQSCTTTTQVTFAAIPYYPLPQKP